MVREDGKRNFALREEDGSEPSVFSGSTPRQAALKAARRLEAASSEEEAPRETLRLREKGTDKVHKYEGWSWEEEAPDNSPDWMPEEITEANVSKQGIEHLDEA
ncbi:non-histone chromosomal MC1 family protein [Halorubrum gandharaense]